MPGEARGLRAAALRNADDAAYADAKREDTVAGPTTGTWARIRKVVTRPRRAVFGTPH